MKRCEKCGQTILPSERAEVLRHGSHLGFVHYALECPDRRMDRAVGRLRSAMNRRLGRP